MPEDQRIAYLNKVCGEDESLRAEVLGMLAHDQSPHPAFAGDGGADGPVAMAWAIFGDETVDPDSDAPESIGDYRILRVIGEGGMGVVYEAEQREPRRRVALKVMRPGSFSPGSLRRFRREAEALALLHHPGIAQIYAAGEDDIGEGLQPYFVMELIDGLPLLQYADRNRLRHNERLELVARIADGLQHAHDHGVVHRDLKPGNILIEADGQPKILDFGVARISDADVQTVTIETTVGQLVGTLPYMSPEQAAGDPAMIDTRSDVYSLGVMTYELLTRRMPYAVNARQLPEAVRAICQDEPTRLSSIDRALRGDIDTIVSKALEKEVDRRYQSAAEFAADVRRHLHDEPITARPASTLYQLRKFARRNRGLVAGLALTALVLVSGIVVSTWLAIDATAARNRMQIEAATAEALNEFFIQDMLTSAVPEKAQGREITVREVIENAASRVEASFEDQPEAEAAVREALGNAFRGLSDLTSAELQLRRSWELRKQTVGEMNEKTLTTLNSLCTVLQDIERFDEAETLRRQLTRDARRHLGPDSYLALTSLHNLITLLNHRDKYEEALTLGQQLYERRVELLGPNHKNTVDTLHNIGFTLGRLGRLDEALDVARQVNAIDLENSGPNHPDTLDSMHLIGALLKHLDRFDEAEEQFRLTLARREHVYGADDLHVAQSKAGLAETLLQRGDTADLPEAEVLIRTAVEIYRLRLPAESTLLADTESTLGLCLLLQSRHDEALPLLLDCHDRLAAALDASDDRVRDAVERIVRVYEATGNTAQAASWRQRLPAEE